MDRSDMAEAIGISQSAYSKIECGYTHVSVVQLISIVQSLGVSTLELLRQAGVADACFEADGFEKAIARAYSSEPPQEVHT